MVRAAAIFLTYLTIAALLTPVVAASRDDRDNDVARDLYLHGQIRALSDILPVVEANTAGDIVSIRLDNVGGRWIYEFVIVVPNGRRVMVEADAAAATIINTAVMP